MRNKINRGICACLILNAQLINSVFRYMTIRKESTQFFELRPLPPLWTSPDNRYISILCPQHLELCSQLFLLRVCVCKCVCTGVCACMCACLCTCEICGLCGSVYLHMFLCMQRLEVNFEYHSFLMRFWETVSY